jgi:hypothetical protein
MDRILSKFIYSNNSGDQHLQFNTITWSNHIEAETLLENIQKGAVNLKILAKSNSMMDLGPGC